METEVLLVKPETHEHGTAIFKSRNGESGNDDGECEKQEREKPESLKTGTRKAEIFKNEREKYDFIV